MTGLRIALLTYSTKPRGSVVHTLALAEALAAAGQEVTVWTLGRGGDAGFFRPVDPAVRQSVVPFPDGPPEETVGERVLRSIAVLREAFAASAAEYDIVHAQDCISANAAASVTARCVRTVHHVDHFTTPELAACHERAVVEPYAHICVSRSVADELADGWGLKPAVIPNGVAYDRFATTDPAARAAWRSRLGPYVLTVGGIEPRKGSLDLLEAYALLRTGHPGVRLVIAGGETLFDYRDYRAAFEARATELGITPEIEGVLADDEMPTLVAEASVLAMVSAREGFGLAGMEALAAGVPVVARDLPVLHEVYGDTVAFAQDAPGIAAALARQLSAPLPLDVGRVLAASYTWKRAAAAHLTVYQGFLARS